MERNIEQNRFTHFLERDENGFAAGGFTFCTLTKNDRRMKITEAEAQDHAKETREC
jgi:hypothetical protein